MFEEAAGMLLAQGAGQLLPLSCPRHRDPGELLVWGSSRHQQS